MTILDIGFSTVLGLNSYSLSSIQIVPSVAMQGSLGQGWMLQTILPMKQHAHAQVQMLWVATQPPKALFATVQMK